MHNNIAQLLALVVQAVAKKKKLYNVLLPLRVDKSRTGAKMQGKSLLLSVHDIT